jgi:hypothetical protein
VLPAQVLLEQLVYKGFRDRTVCTVQLEQREKLEQLEQQAHWEQLDQLARRAQPEYFQIRTHLLLTYLVQLQQLVQ